MVRTQQTAAPLAHALGKQVEVLPGLQEINAGWYNGKPKSMAKSTYLLAPADWLNGDRQRRHPRLDQRQRVQRPVHRRGAEDLRQRPQQPGGVLARRVDHVLDAAERDRTPRTAWSDSHPLPNMGRVVINGSPIDRLDAGRLGRHPRLQVTDRRRRAEAIDRVRRWRPTMARHHV